MDIYHKDKPLKSMETIKKILWLVLSLISLQAIAQKDENTTKLTQYINRGQLVYYSESSIMSDTRASSITYVDFCPGGKFYYSYDGSFTVKGTQNTSNQNNRVNGAGVANNSGQWQVLGFQGAYYLEIIDAYGQKNYYPINIQNLIAGKWKYRNTTYVFAKGQGRCGN